MFKKRVNLTAVLLIIFCILTACGNKDSSASGNKDKDSTKNESTTEETTNPALPIYDALSNGAYQEAYDLFAKVKNISEEDKNKINENLKGVVSTLKEKYINEELEYQTAVEYCDIVEKFGFDDTNTEVTTIKEYISKLNDSRNAYKLAEGYFEAENYDLAIQNYILVWVEDANYESALDKCEMAKKSKVLTVDEIKSSEKVLSYFEDVGLTITEATLEKRQTNIEDKEDIAYLKITASNSQAMCNEIFKVTSTYYDVGGWQVDDVRCDSGFEYEPLGLPEVEITDAVVVDRILTDDVYTCEVYYTINRTGEVADIEETWCQMYTFSNKTGLWSRNFTKDAKLHNWKVSIKASSGMYAHVNSEQYEDKYYIEFNGDEATLIYYAYNSDFYNPLILTSNGGTANIQYYKNNAGDIVYYYEFAGYNSWNRVFLIVETDELRAKLSKKGVVSGTVITLE